MKAISLTQPQWCSGKSAGHTAEKSEYESNAKVRNFSVFQIGEGAILCRSGPISRELSNSAYVFNHQGCRNTFSVTLMDWFASRAQNDELGR